MATLRSSRFASALARRQPVGFSASPLRASIRPNTFINTQVVARYGIGVRNLSMGAFAETAVQSTQDIMVTIHATGVPWTLTITTMAFLVAAVRLPLLIYSMRIRKIQAEATPLISAWRYQIRANRLQEALRMAQERKRILRDRKAQDWRAWTPVLGIPAWLAATEAIRRLCGARSGLMAMITGNHQETTEQTMATLSSSAGALSNGIQPSVDFGLANGGALWFTDLTAADPIMALPAILCVTMISTFVPRDKNMRDLVFDLRNSQVPYLTPGMKWRIRFIRGLLLTSVVIPATCCNLPAGLFLYWIFSMWIVKAWERLVVDTTTRSPRVVMPCKNPQYVMLQSHPSD